MGEFAGSGGSCGFGGFTSTGAILVLFILLVIILSSCFI
ncbi:sporulation protein YjcZ [Paenibacillus sp. E194]|nr:sporulation protein YjcZ [Paenibacillus sp. E194]